jgi:hypothetical protein
MAVKSSWPCKILQGLKTSSSVDLEGEHIDDLSRLGQHKMMRHLNLSYVQITSLAGLKPQPNLESLTAIGSRITSFQNFSAIAGIRRLVLNNTPVARAPQFVLSAVLICPNLTSLNERQIPDLTRNRAKSYPYPGRLLVDAGWLAEFPYPPDDRLADLAVKFGVVEPEEEEDAQTATEEAEDRFEDVLAGLWRRHEKLVKRAQCRSQGITPEPDDDSVANEEVVPESRSAEGSSDLDTPAADPGGEEEEPSLLLRVAGLLRENDMELDDADLYNSVLLAVENLCVEVNDHRMSSLDDVNENSEGETQ